MAEDKKPLFESVETVTIPEAIFRQVRGKIVRGELKPGDKLPSERELAALFRRSRPSIREALRMLELFGLIETTPGSAGAVVKGVSLTSVEQTLENAVLLRQMSIAELYEFRAVNEVATAQWAVLRRTPEDIARLRALLAEAADCRDIDALNANNTAFHTAIVEASRNAMAKVVYAVISGLIAGAMCEGLAALTREQLAAHAAEIARDHAALVDAIEDQNADEASTLMFRHISRFRYLVDKPQ